jgi:hypothetical protein
MTAVSPARWLRPTYGLTPQRVSAGARTARAGHPPGTSVLNRGRSGAYREDGTNRSTANQSIAAGCCRGRGGQYLIAGLAAAFVAGSSIALAVRQGSWAPVISVGWIPAVIAASAGSSYRRCLPGPSGQAKQAVRGR